MNQNYNKTFFKKPLLTSENIRLFSITLMVAIFVIAMLNLSINWAKRLPSYILRQNITVKYISFLTEEKAKFQTADLDILGSNPSLPPSSKGRLAQKDVSSKVVSSGLENWFERGTILSKEFETLPEQSTEEIFTIYAADDKPGELVNSAISRIPGPIVGETTPGKGEQPLYFSEEEEYYIQFKESIQIRQPKFIKAASSNGNRNPDETLAILESNEVDVKHCFEKFSRYDPNFSGDIKISFTIHPEGFVIPSSIRVLNSNITDTRVISCIKTTIQRWKNFPSIAMEDGIFTITRKYIF